MNVIASAPAVGIIPTTATNAVEGVSGEYEKGKGGLFFEEKHNPPILLSKSTELAFRAHTKRICKSTLRRKHALPHHYR